MPGRRAVVLLSGGLDSATAFAVARAEGFDCYALSFDYGQRHDREIDSARRLAERFALPRERVLLQPEGLRAEELAARTPWLVEACKAHRFRFSPRLHILIWGARRGV